VSQRHAQLVAFIVSAWLWPGDASAGSLRWTVAEDCPDAQALQAELRRVLADPAGVLATFDIEGAVVRDQARGYTLWLQLWSPGMGEKPAVRELQGATCEELLEAAVVAVALAADAARSEVAPAFDSESPFPRSASSAVAAVPRAPAVAWLLGASALLDTAVLPAAALGSELQLAFTYRGFRFGLGGGWIPTSSRSIGAAGRADFGLLFGEARGCGQLPLGAAGALAYVCATFEVGRLSAAWQRSTRSTAWRAVAAGVGGSLPLGSPLALAGSFDLLAPLTRPVFMVNGVDVFQSARLAWRAQLGLIFTL
jgi:hypothetical protein